ncbi:MAG: hypothetical protein WHV67_03545 [Thermoanaerobaculia bacterium]
MDDYEKGVERDIEGIHKTGFMDRQSGNCCFQSKNSFKGKALKRAVFFLF